MRIAILGRTEILYDTTLLLQKMGYEIGCIITSKEAPEYSRTSKDFEALAQNINCPFLHSSNIEKVQQFLEELPPMEICVSINYTGVIPESIINLFKIGILNAHGGDLPKYRGNACVAWAIINGEERIGLCIHKMIGGELDSGNIIARDYYPVTTKTTITEVFNWMNLRTVELFIEAVEKLKKDRNFILEEQSKEISKALRGYPRLPEDGQINWNNSNVVIQRLINASNKPFSGAFTYFEGKKMIIWDAEIVEEYENYLAIVGQVTKINSDSIEVAAGEGKIRIKTIEIDGIVTSPNTIIKSIRKRLNTNK